MDKQPNILIKEALQLAVEEINKGSHPNTALKKSAEYYDLNHNFVHRTGEALNTALHFSHFKHASDKAANFPLADINKVINDLYKENEKTANHEKSEFFPSADLFNPIPDLDKIFRSPQHKEAYLKIANTPQDEKTPLSPKAVMEKSSNYVREMEKQLDNAKTKEAGAKLDMDAAFFNLTDDFRKDAGSRTSFEEFESQAYSKYGEMVVPYLDLMHKHANLHEPRGVHDKGYIMFNECSELKKLSKFFNYIDEADKAVKEAADAEENMKFEKDYIAQIYKSAEELKKKSIDKTAGMLQDVLKHVQDSLKNEQKKNPGPYVNEAMDLFEQQAVLQDLLIRDPILSKENPHVVVNAFEQIVRLSPHVAKEKDVVRALLRQMTAGQSLAPHSANQLTEANINMIKLKMLQQGHQPPK